ncbi:MAG: nucleotidyltransferase domain-containing protein, partial [Deltaproteobacteria bacterium]|nr:nucleotidyltransferase domain-containing protein [Deltaproteobacteria bacterium]
MPTTTKKANAKSRGKSLSRDDIRTLRDVFEKHPAIQAVYVFGSTGSGTTHLGSDLDLAIVARSRTMMKKKIALLTDLAQRGFCNVDLVFLDTEDIVLKYEAVRQNRLIYATP